MKINPLGCYKRKYESEREARVALKKARRGGLKEYYQCQHCGNYHLTSKRTRREHISAH